MNYLPIKSLAGLLNLLVIMGAALFLTAGSTDYMAAWYYLAMFFGCVIVITVYIFIYDKQLLQSRLKVGAMAEKRKTQKIIQAIASVGFLGMYLIAGFDYRFGWSQMWPSIAQLSLGMVFIAMALLFVVF